MRNSTKLFLEMTVPESTHYNVDIDACANNGYSWNEYFIAKGSDEEIKDKIVNYITQTDEDEDLYGEPDISLIQQRVAEVLFNNNSSPSKIKDIKLFLPEDLMSHEWEEDPGYEESYCLGNDAYLVLETDDCDFVLKIESDFYDPWDELIESAELIAKFDS